MPEELSVKVERTNVSYFPAYEGTGGGTSLVLSGATRRLP